jgi:glycyl-tRNA synthetase alpha chain
MRRSVKALLAQWPNILKGGLDLAKMLNEHGKDPSYSQILRFPTLGAYELALKCSHVFNLLDARGAISVTERVGVMARIRTLVVGVAKMYVEQGLAVEPRVGQAV